MYIILSFQYKDWFLTFDPKIQFRNIYIMLPKAQRPHFIRSIQKQKERSDKCKSKMLFLVLKRTFYSKMKTYLHHMIAVQQKQYNTLNSAFKRIQRNVQFCKLMCWKKLFAYAKLKAKEQKIIKFVPIVSEGYLKHRMALAFRKINNYGWKKYVSSIRNIQRSKNSIMKFALNKLMSKIKKQAFSQIQIYSIRKQTKQSRSIIVSKQVQKIYYRNIYYSWSRILGTHNDEHKDVEHELGQLNKQINIFKKQLSKKDLYIQQLKNTAQQRRQKTQSNQEGSSRRNYIFQNSGRKSFKSAGSRRDLSRDSSERGGESFQGNNSILSWLNRSVLSIKSGKSSKSRQLAICCNCGYRQKYNKYRTQKTSLKNQLQIIKNQLQVTKQLNQHLQFQIQNFYENPIQSKELQLLKRETKELKKQKQMLKQKLIKTQKYIANLKCQFKMKIQNLYRNLKKCNQ